MKICTYDMFPIINAKLLISQFEELKCLKQKLIKKNKIIGNLQKANYSLKNLLNETIGSYKYPVPITYKKKLMLKI